MLHTWGILVRAGTVEECCVFGTAKYGDELWRDDDMYSSTTAGPGESKCGVGTCLHLMHTKVFNQLTSSLDYRQLPGCQIVKPINIPDELG